MVQSPEDDEPKIIQQVLSSFISDKWKKPMEEEIRSIKFNKVWTLVDLPQGCMTIDNKWILKLKRKTDYSVERYKVHPVSKGYTQREGMNYEEIFSPIV